MIHLVCTSVAWVFIHKARFTIYAWASVSVFACVATGSAYKMIWTHVTYAGIEIISILVYTHVATRVQIILYALPVTTLAQAYIVNWA